jgi:hypothetical protein
MKKFFLPTLIFLALTLTACGSSALVTESASQTEAPAEGVVLPEIAIEAADHSYSAPETTVEGWTRVTLTNSGSEPHHVQFLRLNDDVTEEQFNEALEQGEGPALALVKQVGGVGSVHPGGTAQAIINLPAGNYMILCFVPSPSDGVPHIAKGMIKSLTVEPASGKTAEEPTADLTIHMKDFMFEMPETMPAGQVTIEIINDGPEPHEFNILRLEDGKTIANVNEFLLGLVDIPPFAPVGGLNGMDMGLKGYTELNLEPGIYVAICYIPSPKAEGLSHHTLGMIKQFIVE